MLYPQNFEQKIGFEQIRALVIQNCLCNLGKEKAIAIQFQTQFEVIKHQLILVAELKTILEIEEYFPSDNYIDATSFLEKIKVEGQYADLEEIVLLRDVLGTFKKLAHYFKQIKIKEKYPHLTALGNQIDFFPYITERIDHIINQNGQIKDNATPELNQIRKQIRHKETDIHNRMQQIHKQATKDGVVEEGVSISIRNGRPVIPVSVYNKKSISGIIHDESQSGKTVFIEPTAVVELNNELKEYIYAEQREIRKILIGLANDIRPYTPELETNFDLLGEIDLIRAKAKIAIVLDAKLPMLSEKPVIQWREARHPLLYLQFKNEGNQVVPLTIHLSKEKHLLVISGPNAGGKSVCLKTVGIVQYMMQCGLLPTLTENSEMGIFNQLFIDIGDEQSIENDLSTYSSHLVSMKHFLKNANESTVVLIDEFGTGTEPVLGGAIAEAVLAELNLKKTFGVITTHYANLKHYASQTEGTVNGAMMFDMNKLEPTYQLSMGKPGSSFAFEIARKIGLPEEVLKSAEEKVGAEHVDFDKNLRKILRDKKYWEDKRQSVRLNEKRLSEILGRYEDELKKVEGSKKEILKEAKAEAQQIIDQANKRVENVIKEIKEAQAEKERTREARKNLEDYKDGLSEKQQKSDKYTQKMQKIKHRKDKLGKHRPDLKEAPVKKEQPKVEDQIQIGDTVRMKDQDTYGEVLEVNTKSLMVAFGNLITTIDPKKVEKSSKNKAKKQRKQSAVTTSNFSVSKRKMNFKPNLDVRGKRADEAMQQVSEFIDEAIMVGSGELRILHGKGNGILREVIRDFLSTVNVVGDFRDENIEMGGSGITVVKLHF